MIPSTTPINCPFPSLFLFFLFIHMCVYIYIYIYIRGCLDSLENQQRSLSLHVGNIKGCDDVFRVSQALGMSVSWRGNPDGLCDGTFCALFHKQLWLQPWRSSFSCLIKGESEPSFYALFTSVLSLVFVLFWFICLCFKMCFLRSACGFTPHSQHHVRLRAYLCPPWTRDVNLY